MSDAGPASNSEDDLAAIQPGTFDKVSGAALLLCGFFTALLGAQTYGVVRLVMWTVLVILVMLALGLSTMYFGFKVTRRRGWAALGGTVTAGLIVLLGVVWVVFSISNGLLSLLALGVVPLGMVAAVLSGLQISPGRKADAARARLQESGLEAGY